MRWKTFFHLFFLILSRVVDSAFVALLSAAAALSPTPTTHRQAEEPRPQPPLRPLDQTRLRLDDRGEEVAVPVLVLAPVLKVLEERVGDEVGVALQVAVDGDVAPVTDLLRKVGGVDDVLGLFELSWVGGGEGGREREKERVSGMTEGRRAKAVWKRETKRKKIFFSSSFSLAAHTSAIAEAGRLSLAPTGEKRARKRGKKKRAQEKQTISSP